ncbi:hypothetical protein F4678DRAFT_468252 [Xylaria arbuscula]|nr:hypothetical protein F4678DRAFT_468252 [Xylaria arbuscula]
MPQNNTCTGETKAGIPCQAWARNGRVRCRHHPHQSQIPIRNHVANSSNTNSEEEKVTFQSNDESRMYNATNGTQNNGSGSGNQFPGASITGDVNISSNSNTNCGNHTINNTTQIAHEATAVEQKLPETRQEFHFYVANFTSNNLRGFEFDYEELAKRAADIMESDNNNNNNNFALDRNLIHKVVKLGLFDFMVFCDNSSSMRRKQRVLEDTLKRLAKIANILTPTGISIRFLHSTRDENGNYDGLSSNDIEKKFKELRFKKGSQLGTAVDRKIIKPLAEKAERHKLKKPVIVIIITDSEPHGEDPDTLMNAIFTCKGSNTIKSLGRAAVVFVVTRIGNSASATRFLDRLANAEKTRGMVYCSTESLDQTKHADGRALSPPGDTTSKVNEYERESLAFSDKGLDIRILSGRMLILAQPSFSLGAKVTQLFDDTPPGIQDKYPWTAVTTCDNHIKPESKIVNSDSESSSAIAVAVNEARGLTASNIGLIQGESAPNPYAVRQPSRQ